MVPLALVALAAVAFATDHGPTVCSSIWNPRMIKLMTTIDSTEAQDLISLYVDIVA